MARYRGPTTLSHMTMYVGNGIMYVYIWEEAVDVSDKGVYMLDDREQRWCQIIAGEIDNGLKISPNGYQISFAKKSILQIMDVYRKNESRV